MQNYPAPTAPAAVFNKRKQISIISLALAVYIVVASVFQILIALAVNLFFPSLYEISFMPTLLALLPQYLIAFPIFLLIVRLAKPADVKGIIYACGLRPITKFNVFKAFLAAYCGMYLTNVVTVFVIGIISGGFDLSSRNPLIDVLPQQNIISNGIMAGIIAPIIEEFMFRKIIIDRTIIFGSKFAIIFSGVTFGIFHGNFMQCFYAGIIGLVLAYVYTRSGKIWYTIAIHMAINLMSTVILPLFLKLDLIGMFILSPILMIIVISGGVMFMLNRKKLLFINSSFAIERGRRFKTVIFNAGMIAFIITSIMLFTYTTFNLFGG